MKGTIDEAALARANLLVVAAISDADVIDHCGNDDLRDYLAVALIDTFVQLLRGTRIHILHFCHY